MSANERQARDYNGMIAKKQFGQNFLKSKSIISSLVRELSIKDIDRVLEIGGGTGVITRELILHNYEELDIVEYDADLLPSLEEVILGKENTTVIHDDILNYLPNGQHNYTKVMGALPYYITSPIIHHLLRLQNRPEIIILIVQKEVGQKLIQNPPKGSYWSHITLGYQVSKVCMIQRHEFDPAPSVDSMGIKLTYNEADNKYFDAMSFKQWEHFLHNGFKNPRKMINKKYDQTDLDAVGIDLAARPQHVTRDQWLRLYEQIYGLEKGLVT